ncbi:MAG TPA: hypothetical protein VH643_31085 [Gemmataceae bacterium]|jgi:hypothetical protein
MWQLEPTDDYERQFRRYEKKHPRELEAVLRNLQTYFEALRAGNKPLQIKYGFVHVEPDGIFAIDQKGGGLGKLAQSRLYVYPDTDTEILHLLTIGGKGHEQRNDIQQCKDFVAQIKERGPHDDKEVTRASQQRETPDEHTKGEANETRREKEIP